MTEIARAIVEQGDGSRLLQEIETPRCPPGGLLLRTVASGLCGTDLFKQSGRLAAGTVLGHELVGEVLETADSERFPPGCLVVCPHHRECGHCDRCRQGAETQCSEFRENLLSPGAFATHVAVSRRALDGTARRLPKEIEPETAVFLEPAACVLRVAAGCYHIQNVNSLHARYDNFIKPFCGPATKNLNGYIRWLELRLAGLQPTHILPAS